MYKAGNECMKHKGEQGSCIVKLYGHQEEDRFSAQLSWIIIKKRFQIFVRQSNLYANDQVFTKLTISIVGI
jgi:hypothetical protein